MLEFSNSSRPASSRGGGGGARAFDRKMLVLSIFRGFRSLPKKKSDVTAGGQGLSIGREGNSMRGKSMGTCMQHA
jgi:hypothetical protein